MNFDTIKIFLAAIFDFFKLKSPQIAAFFLAVLTIIAYNFTAIAADFNVTDPTFLAIAKWVNLILLALTGSHSSVILGKATPTTDVE